MSRPAAIHFEDHQRVLQLYSEAIAGRPAVIHPVQSDVSAEGRQDRSSHQNGQQSLARRGSQRKSLLWNTADAASSTNAV